MSTTTTQRPPRGRPRRAALDHETAMSLAATEYDRVLALLRELTPEDWRQRTDCPAWDVRDIAAHMLGMAEMSASLRENVRQIRAAQRRGGTFIDALTALQVQERRHLEPTQLVEQLTTAAPRAARGRRRTPSPVRALPMPIPQQVGDAVEPWTVGYLVDVITTRDPWMHRIDVSRATGRDPVLTPEHDGVLVGDVAAEWAQRHGGPCALTLTGSAGGSWSFGRPGPDDPVFELDAVEFCRTVSWRERTTGLLGVHVPF